MLSPLDRDLLDLERGWWLEPGPKEWIIRDRIGLGASDYYRRLARLVWAEEAEAYDPLTIRRLRRLVGSARPTAGTS